jgi:hypothetical protein
VTSSASLGLQSPLFHTQAVRHVTSSASVGLQSPLFHIQAVRHVTRSVSLGLQSPLFHIQLCHEWTAPDRLKYDADVARASAYCWSMRLKRNEHPLVHSKTFSFSPQQEIVPPSAASFHFFHSAMKMHSRRYFSFVLLPTNCTNLFVRMFVWLQTCAGATFISYHTGYEHTASIAFTWNLHSNHTAQEKRS